MGAAIATIALGLASRTWLTGLSAKVLGVALWATLVYWLVVLVSGARTGRAAAAALVISFAVELAQLTPGPAWLSARHVLLRLIFGSTFSVWDLPMYAAGVALGAVVHRRLARGPARRA